MNIQIISIGKLSNEIASLVKRFEKMITWQVKNFELAHSKKQNLADIKQDEAKLIAAKIRESSYVIVLDLKAKQMSSESFSKIFTKQMMAGKNIDFIIGGAFGLSCDIINRANLLLSLSEMTFPHQFAKLLLLEQIYRAQSLISSHPYHK
ncbi:MAG: 23S rRNA (pseudouridine(1915)-N(3))-methyltransferase RlmH [Rickettsiales bacterium]|nr:MAG: 23S rRNA (pseudouridine(1915)-N(3))-methyltransferase RlmH [Rickettsiales bacterium]